MSFINKVVLVTGAASGLGETIAFHFAKRSARLALVDINENDLKKSADTCEKLSKAKVLRIVADLRKDEDLKNVVERTVKEYGQIDVVVNCAGIWEETNLLDPNVIKSFDAIAAVNLRAVVSLTEKVAPVLIESKGSIVNISSVTGVPNISGSGMYAITKAGVSYFTKCAALELAAQGVRVNAILPGYVKTNIVLNSGKSVDEDEDVWKSGAKLAPLKRISSAEEMAALVAYLASDQAISITGVNYVVDNGILLK